MTLESHVYREGLAIERSPLGGKTAADVPEISKLLTPYSHRLQDITRLVILVPETSLRPGWWKPVFEWLNVSNDVEIALVALCDLDRNGWAKRRRLNAQLSLVQKEYPRAYGRTINQPDWANALQGFTRKSDLLVCFPEQQVVDGFANRQALSQALLRVFDLPVIEASGAYPSAGVRLWGLAKQALFQLFPFVAVALFLWIQMQINQQTHGLAYQIAVSATVLVEIGLIFVWSLFLD